MKNWDKGILMSGYDKKDTDLNNHRKKIVNMTVLYAVPILMIFSILNMQKGIVLLSYVDAMAATFLLVSFFYLRKTKDVFKSTFGILFSLYIVFIAGLFSAGIANSTFFWFFIFPPLSIFFFGAKKGLYFIYALILSILVFYVFSSIVDLELTYDKRLLLVLIIALGVITRFIVFYETLRENYEKTIIKQNIELADLNKELKTEVKNEVHKNIIKDQQILQQSKLAQMGEMLSMIAHQWRQPLNAISLTANNLKIKLLVGDIDKNVFEKEFGLIDDYSQHLSKTIDDFRLFFQEEKTKERTTLEKIIISTLEIVRTSVENKNIKIVTNLNCNVEVETYPSEIKQVLLNLIKNAEDVLLDNQTKNPTITISTLFLQNTNNVQLIVQDNAGGIPTNIIGKIFEPYFSTKKDKEGTGLGLYMSKTIIEEHCSGHISVKNDENGAVFTIACCISAS